MLDDIWPPFDMDMIRHDDERLARYTYINDGNRREGVCVAKPTEDGGMSLLIGETALRIRYQRMMTGDSDSIVRAYTGLVPNKDGLDGPLSVNYRLPGKVISARFVQADEARPPMRTQHGRSAATKPAGRKETSMQANQNIPNRPSAESSRGREARGERWPRVNFPNAFVRPFQHTARDGRQWDMMGITLPKGTRLNGVELGGWRLTAFADKHNTQDKANGRPVTISFRPDRPIDLYKGKGEERQTMRIDNPWDLCKAVKAGQDAWQQRHRPGSLSGPSRMDNPSTDAVAQPSQSTDVWEEGIDIARNEHYTIPLDPSDPSALSGLNVDGSTHR